MLSIKSKTKIALASIFTSVSIFSSVFISPSKAEEINKEEKVDVIIVGAGLSGLTTAYKLKKAGLKYKLLEINTRVGGRARTAKYSDEVHVEAGLAEFWDSNPALKIIKELGIKTHDSEAYSSFVYQGKVQKYLAENDDEFLKSIFNKTELEAFKKFGKKVHDYIEKIHNNKIDKTMFSFKNISLEDWVKKDKLPKKVEHFIRCIVEPEIGTSWSLISALDGIAELHMFVGKTEAPHEIEGGNDTLMEKLADNIGRDNINLGTQVMRFKNLKDSVEIDAMDTSNFKHHTYKAKYAVSTIPLFRLAELQFDPQLPEKKKEAISTQTWGSYFTAHVFFKPEAKKYWEEKDGSTYLPILSDSPLGVIYSANENKKDGGYIVNLLITGAHAEGFNHRAVLFENVRNELNQAFEKFWKGSSKLITKYQFYRYHPRAIAAWPVGRSRFDELSNEIRKPFGRIYFAGDFTESSHSDGAVISAERVVNDILKLETKKITK
ncbi:MAG: NAD(P)/FAD-dependent oxidoreductase [Candidatus Sericytochromatia bacterium]